jgi:hypothetical protein
MPSREPGRNHFAFAAVYFCARSGRGINARIRAQHHHRGAPSPPLRDRSFATFKIGAS